MDPREGESDTYEVSGIVNVKEGPKKVKFKVHWKGYKGEDSWEPWENVQNCTTLLRGFFTNLYRDPNYRDFETETVISHAPLSKQPILTTFKPATRIEEQREEIPDQILEMDEKLRLATVSYPNGSKKTIEISELIEKYPTKVCQYYMSGIYAKRGDDLPEPTIIAADH